MSMMGPLEPRSVLLEGRPGVGKTTVSRRLVETLRARGVQVDGFTTEEIRVAGRRLGFAIETMAGERGVLAHVDLPGPPRVGKYGVDLPTFERLALGSMSPAAGVVIIDELGKMELASERFRHEVEELFAAKGTVVATVHAFAHPFTDALKAHPSVELVRVTPANRDGLPRRLADALLSGP